MQARKAPFCKICCAATLLLAGAAPALAQYSQGGGQNSFGGGSFGNNMGGNSFGNSFGGGSLGGNSFGGGSFGSGTGGGFGSGMGGFGNSSLGGTGAGQNSMGNNQQGGQGFVGRDSADMASIFNELGRNSNQFMQQLNRTMGRGNRGRQNSSQGENAVLPVRVQLNVAFDHPQVQSTIVAKAVRGRLEKLITRRNIAAPEVEVVGDTVVLRGVAPSESQRLVIEKLVSLEPGVYSVENQMTVEEEPSRNPPVPPQADN